MSDLVNEMERAMNLHIRGRPEEAVAIGRLLLTRSRGTPYAASVHRHMAEFLVGLGHYDRARETALDASSIARATRNPEELLAAQIAVLSCDYHEGELATVFREISELMRLAKDQIVPRVMMGRVLTAIGNFEDAVDHLDETRGQLDEVAAPGAHPGTDVLRADLMLMQGKSLLLANRLEDAAALLELAMSMDIPTLVPGIAARALLGLALTRLGKDAEGRELCDQASGLGRKVSNDVHGHALAMSGLARLQTGELGVATEQLRSAVGLLTHAIDRQEGYCALGEIAGVLDLRPEAVAAYRRAVEPTTDSYFGRRAVRSLHQLVGFKVV